MNWLYENKEVIDISQLPDTAIGFVYKITNIETGKFYVGKKSLASVTNKLLTKKEQSEWNKPGRIPKKKKVVKESDWKDYWGSSKDLLLEIKQVGKEKFKRDILKICYTKSELTYFEVYYQFEYKVLHVDSYNNNVLGKFYRKDASGAHQDAQNS